MIRALCALLLLGVASAASAHPLAPALMELRETAVDRYLLSWRTSVVRVRGDEVRPLWPASCTTRGADDTQAVVDAEALVQRWTLHCPGGLVGRDLGVRGLERSGINVIVRIEPLHGEATQTLLDARRPQFTVPPTAAAAPVFLRYLGLGVEHLLLGPDHLLFVLGLLLLVRGLRRLALTVTAFTVGHSLTLALATLGVVRVNPALTELAIAASLLALAVAAARPVQAPGSLFARHPWAVASGFGLVHGLGFAGALAQIGLPQRELPQALLAFNLGIELGQLLAIGAVLAVVHLRPWRGSDTRMPVVRLASYLIGVPAAAWCLERATVLFA